MPRRNRRMPIVEWSNPQRRQRGKRPVTALRPAAAGLCACGKAKYPSEATAGRAGALMRHTIPGVRTVITYMCTVAPGWWHVSGRETGQATPRQVAA